MTQLAIKGHLTRGEEVIKLLEMLGGDNVYSKKGSCDSSFYYISGQKRICQLPISVTHMVLDLFTLEEFIEKFPYKVGDKVQHSRGIGIITSMHWDDMNSEMQYNVCVNNETWITSVNFLKHCKEQETVEENLTIQDIRDNNAEWLLNKLQEMSAKNVLQIINDLHGELHKPQYPKTYKECCDVLGIGTMDNDAQGYKVDIIIRFQELLIARDAYWKIAREELGLGKPWEPDWNDTNTQKYCIYNVGNDFKKQPMLEVHHFLAFPTAEMRDAFYENFKELIEQCKELL